MGGLQRGVDSCNSVFLSLKVCEATELWIHYCNCQGMTDTGIPYKVQQMGFCYVGGVRNTNEAWLYSTGFGQVTKLPSMNCIRAGHGCVNCHHTVYVLAGWE